MVQLLGQQVQLRQGYRSRHDLFGEKGLQGASELVLTAHPDGCVLLYPRRAWEPVRAQVEKFPSFNPQTSAWKRLLLGFEEHLSPDTTGRILVSPALRRHASLERDVMMLGQGQYFEIWDDALRRAKLEKDLGTGSGVPPGMENFSL